jgi:hypothetical protein
MACISWFWVHYCSIIAVVNITNKVMLLLLPSSLFVILILLVILNLFPIVEYRPYSINDNGEINSTLGVIQHVSLMLNYRWLQKLNSHR